MHVVTRGLIVIFMSALLVSACSVQATPVPTMAPDVFYTQAAQTMIAQNTLQAGATAVAELTRIASLPTNTLSPTTSLPSSTPVLPTPTTTPVTPTATPPPSSCDRAELAQDFPLPNNATLNPGDSFTKVWQIQNIGSCIWTPAYSLVLVGGQASYDSTQVDLPGTIRPGDIIALSVDGNAPIQTGSYSELWMLRNPQGQLFGSGVSGMDPFTIQLIVTQSFSGNLVLTWHRQGGSNQVCDELRIYLIDKRNGSAVASTCRAPRQVIGSMSLSRADSAQVSDWVKKFRDYNVEIYSAIPGGPPLQAYMTFNGQGDVDAPDADIQIMQSLAESLFNTISP